jgi:hypothetical protein
MLVEIGIPGRQLCMMQDHDRRKTIAGCGKMGRASQLNVTVRELNFL